MGKRRGGLDITDVPYLERMLQGPPPAVSPEEADPATNIIDYIFEDKALNLRKAMTLGYYGSKLAEAAIDWWDWKHPGDDDDDWGGGFGEGMSQDEIDELYRQLEEQWAEAEMLPVPEPYDWENETANALNYPRQYEPEPGDDNPFLQEGPPRSIGPWVDLGPAWPDPAWRALEGETRWEKGLPPRRTLTEPSVREPRGSSLNIEALPDWLSPDADESWLGPDLPPEGEQPGMRLGHNLDWLFPEDVEDEVGDSLLRFLRPLLAEGIPPSPIGEEPSPGFPGTSENLPPWWPPYPVTPDIPGIDSLDYPDLRRSWLPKAPGEEWGVGLMPEDWPEGGQERPYHWDYFGPNGGYWDTIGDLTDWGGKGPPDISQWDEVNETIKRRPWTMPVIDPEEFLPGGTPNPNFTGLSVEQMMDTLLGSGTGWQETPGYGMMTQLNEALNPVHWIQDAMSQAPPEQPTQQQQITTLLPGLMNLLETFPMLMPI